MKNDASLEALRRQFQRLAERLGKSRWVLQGTIAERQLRRARPRAGGVKCYGPYYQWTFKRAGKTVTVQISAAQARAFQRAVDEQRKVEHNLTQMRELSEQYLTATTEGVPKRKRRNP